MILRRTSPDFRKFFLIEFTKELIKNSISKDILLEKAMKDPDKELEVQTVPEIKSNVIERVFKESKKRFTTPFDDPRVPEKKVRHEFKRLPTRPIRIPKQRLPQRLQYIKPVPMPTEIDLGELNPLLRDPLINSIECNGPDTNIMIKGRVGVKPTKIILTKEQIDDVVQRFSQKAKIPFDEGVFRVAVGKLMFAAIISEVTGTKFLITKMGLR